MPKDLQAAYGHQMWDYYTGGDGYEIVERDDGFFGLSSGPKSYFSSYDEWSDFEKESFQYVRGRVLDVGCGAGRHSLYLQERGFDVVGIDISPLAIEVCKSRGLRNAHVASITQISRQLGTFDTIVMFGNNLSLLGNTRRATWLLRRFHTLTSSQGRIVGQTRDPYQTENPEHLEYHKLNRERGRMPGQVRLRIRYKKYVTPWFDYLFLSQEELVGILEGTGWHATDTIDGPEGIYVAIIDKG